jgi:hypothetical protein
VTGPPPDNGRSGRRVRPYLSNPAAEESPYGVGGANDPSPTRPRPFVLTAGRVAGDPYVGVESQVVSRVYGPMANLAPQLQAIIDLCQESISVAELSARLKLHLGVVQILVGDLRAAGLVDVQTLDINQTHDPELILRVIHGLRAIT